MSSINGLLTHAAEVRQDRRVFELWISLYPWMQIGHIPAQDFAEFKRSLVASDVQRSTKTPEEIEAEIARVVAAYEGR